MEKIIREKFTFFGTMLTSIHSLFCFFKLLHVKISPHMTFNIHYFCENMFIYKHIKNKCKQIYYLKKYVNKNI